VKRRWLIVLAGTSAALSVGAAWLISRLTDSFLLPVVPYVLGNAGVMLAFVVAPALATLFISLAAGTASSRAVVASLSSAVLTIGFAWATWIGLIVAYCGVLGHSCFD